MTENEIIKALSNVSYGGHSCVNCKHKISIGEERCGIKGCNIARNVIDLINRQKAKIKELQKDGETVAIALLKARAEVERLKAEADMADGYADALEERARAEAIKEFAERLKGEFTNILRCNNGYVYGKIDDLVKEMTEDEGK